MSSRTPETAQCNQEPLSLIEYARVIRSYKKFILVTTSVVFTISLIAAFLLPRQYMARVSILPPQVESPGGAFGSQVQGLLSSMPSGLSDISQPADIWIGILDSQSLLDSIIKRFDLRNAYGEDTLEGALEKLRSRVSVEKSDENIISVTVLDNDPQKAADMANAFVEELDRINKELSITSGRRTRIFLEKRLEETRTELAALEDSMKAFQVKSGAVKIDDQSRALIDVVGSLKGQILAKEVELKTLLSYATESNPQVQTARVQLAELNSKLAEFASGAGQGLEQTDILIPTQKIPGLSLSYARLLRDLTIQTRLFEMLTQQYETAKILEAKDSPTVQVLDRAYPPEKHARPRSAVIIVFSTAAALALSILFSFIMNFRRNLHAG